MFVFQSHTQRQWKLTWITANTTNTQNTREFMLYFWQFARFLSWFVIVGWSVFIVINQEKKREPFQWDIQYELCPMNVLFSAGLAFLFCFLFRQRKYKQRSRRNIECIGRLHERAHLTIYKCFAFGAIWKFADKTMNGRSKQNDCFHLKRWILLKDIIDFANFSLFVDFSINAQNLNRIGTQFCNGSLFWLIKINGTTLADGCDLNEYHYYGVSLRTCGCNCRAIVESAAHW